MRGAKLGTPGNPIVVPPGWGGVIEGGGSGEPPPGGGAGGHDELAPVECSDDALAVELVKQFGADWRYASSGEWYLWDGKRWEAEKLRRAWDRSRKVCRRAARLHAPNDNLARKMSSSPTIHAVVRIAETDPAMTIKAEQFDADIWLLNTPACIVDLHTGQPWPHDRGKLMTLMCGAAPIAAGTAGGDIPHWRQFLRDVTGKDPAFENYLQRVAGYLLTGSIEEHAIFFLYGPGGTGKSTFQNILSAVMGDYATTAAMDLFTLEEGTRHTTELATLCGRRLVIAGEVDAGKRWNEANLKTISGGDRISARFIRGDPFTFTPQFKLLLAGNDRPFMRGDDALRRRFHLIPFMHKPGVIDKELESNLPSELSGILAWMIEGEVRRRCGGLMPPKVIEDATNEYFVGADVIGQWIEERCLCGIGKSEDRNVLYADFRKWAERAGERRVPSKRGFLQKVRLVGGVVDAQSGHTRLLQGIGLAARTIFTQGDDPMADPAEQWPRE